MNRVILLGRLAKEPEVRYTQGAEPLAVCRFTVAINRGYAKDGEPNVDFINCVCFGKRGENINKYFSKGNRIAVQGRLQVSAYTDKQGNNRYLTDVVVEEFEFVESKNEETNNSYTPTQQAGGGFSLDSLDDDEDLPF